MKAYSILLSAIQLAAKAGRSWPTVHGCTQPHQRLARQQLACPQEQKGPAQSAPTCVNACALATLLSHAGCVHSFATGVSSQRSSCADSSGLAAVEVDRRPVW